MAKNRFGRAFGDELKKTARASGHFHNKKLNFQNITYNVKFKIFSLLFCFLLFPDYSN